MSIGKRISKFKRSLQVAVITLIAGCFGVALALTTSTPVTSPATSPAPAPSSASTAHHVPGTQIWNLKNADIRAVIQTISLVTGKNFVVDNRVNGKITLVSHKPMTPKEIYQVFLSMLQVLNYSAIPAGNSIKIVPSIDAKGYNSRIATKQHPGTGDEVVVRIIHVENLSAMDLVPIIRPLMQSWGNVSAYPPTNSLILAGSAGNIQRLTALVRNMENQRTTHVNVVHLKNTNATKLAAILKSLQQGQQAKGQMSTVALAADKENNSLLISGSIGEVIEMKSLIKSLDTPGKADDKDTAIFNLKFLDAEKIAPILVSIVKGKSSDEAASSVAQTPQSAVATTDNESGQGSTTAAAAADTQSHDSSIQAEKTDNVIIAHGTPEMLAMVKKIIGKLDVKPQQVLVEALIVTVDESVKDKLGVDWGSGSQTPTFNDDGNMTGATSGEQTPGAINFVGGAINNYWGILPSKPLSAVLNVIKGNGSSNVLDTPSIVVLNNQKATISKGQNIGITNRQYAMPGLSGVNPNNQQDSGIYNTQQRQNVGLHLEVTPRISSKHILELTIHQKDGTVDASTTGPNNTTINESEIKTKVLVHSGDILVLGGLISNEKVKTHSKVPILGDIPLIGGLFSSESTTIEKKNLMIFIRPIILSNNRLLTSQTRKRYRYIRLEQLKERAGYKLTEEDAAMLPRCLVRMRLCYHHQLGQ